VVERFGFLILRRVSSHSDQTVRTGLDMTAQPSMLAGGCWVQLPSTRRDAADRLTRLQIENMMAGGMGYIT
jgi:hypothetical protein